MCDQIVVAGRKVAAELQVDDVEDYDYDNAADRADYCPDVDDDVDAYGKPGWHIFSDPDPLSYESGKGTNILTIPLLFVLFNKLTPDPDLNQN